MALFKFTRGILSGETIAVFNRGEMVRDFTYVDDIVDGVVGCLAHPPMEGVPARVLNIGNHRCEEVLELVSLLEQALGRPAIIRSVPRPAMDVAETYADVDAIGALTGFRPRTPLAEGIPRFVAWFRAWNGSA